MSNKRKNRDIERPHADVRKSTVENPYFQPEHRESSSNPKRINANVNVRESAVETLSARGFLAASQKRAADQFREYWEAAGGKSSSIDYTLDRVDGGKGDPLVGRLTAAQELARCRALLGNRGYGNVQAVCAEGKSLSEIGLQKRERNTVADNLRADLDDLATMWGFQTRQRRSA